MHVPLSFLDLAFVGPGQSGRDAFAASVGAARMAQLVTTRFVTGPDFQRSLCCTLAASMAQSGSASAWLGSLLDQGVQLGIEADGDLRDGRIVELAEQR